ncbi:winged helix-turn-helix domain-containing protein [Phenylobacterium sp. J367]|uniref:winged helix-turn-helix domain-containing protein n=1 Tax=Phenylobacterium sp. J367 TaxID=2898435 RepID=UPI002151D743|nr:winged helix-turn-helix domain-containing protein [Phenylobacterium sp. J367]MCR5881307.1 winged helix-turn-helix domain-containing protein [Phenylobacterium sp. J367]
MRRLGRVVPKVVLEEKLYGMGEELGSNAIPVHVHHLRRKLADANATCAIHTVRGIGYFLQEGRLTCAHPGVSRSRGVWSFAWPPCCLRPSPSAF